MTSACDRHPRPWLKFLSLAFNAYLLFAVSALLFHLASYRDDTLPRTINEAIAVQDIFESVSVWIAFFTVFSSWSPIVYGLAIVGLIAKEIITQKMSTRIVTNTACLLIVFLLVQSMYWALEKGVL